MAMILKDCYKNTGAYYDKVKTPEETLDWVRGRLDHFDVPLLKETVRIDKGRLGIPVYISRYTPEALRVTGTPKQMGKGATARQAEASAVMELMERFSLFSFVKECPKRTGSYPDLTPGAMPVQDMACVFHPGEGAQDLIKELEELFEFLPFEWVHGYRPLDRKNVWIPFSWFWPINEYNGSASGNSLEEAAVQAISEVVERHVCSVISYDKLRTPTIDPTSVKNPVSKELLEKFTHTGVEVVLKDFSLDTGVPTVGAIAWDPATFPSRSEIVYTAGTAPDPERALIRALTEVAQLAGDFDTDGEYVESGLPKFKNLTEADYILASPQTVPITALSDCGADNFRLEVERMSTALSKKGLNVYLLDITHPDLGVPAVYAIIPGNHFRDRTINLDLPFHCARVTASAGYVSPEERIQILGTLERHHPGRFDIAFYQGHLHELMGNFQAALAFYDKALKSNPAPEEIASIYCHRAVCKKENGAIAEAIDELLKARELNPGLKEIHNLLGYCYYRRGEYLMAIESFEQAVSIDPASAIDYANIGSNLRKLGQDEAAINWYSMALELDPSLEWAREHLDELRSGKKNV